MKRSVLCTEPAPDGSPSRAAKILLTGTEFHFGGHEEIPTEEIRYQGSSFTRLAADEPEGFSYLEIRVSLLEMGRRKDPPPFQGWPLRSGVSWRPPRNWWV